MNLSEEIQKFILEEAKTRFLNYVTFDTTSDENTGTHPSTEKQFDLAKVLVLELKELGLR